MPTIKPRERNAILSSLAAGVVPKIGLYHIQVERVHELDALLDDLKKIEDGSATVRFVIGRFGSGKSFFLNLIRTVALERKFIVLQADITVERRLCGTGGHARALYTELLQNMATRAKPDGGALQGLIERFVSEIGAEAGSAHDSEALEAAVKKKLLPLANYAHGMNFIRALARYVEGFLAHNDDLVNNAMRWLRAEYSTRTESNQDLGIRDIIEDSHLYDMIKVWGRFVQLAGYSGLFVNFDEMVVLSERLNNQQARDKNYEVILQILNDCLQGQTSGIGFCFAGTEEFLSDKRRGLFSYEALATRLADNAFAVEGLVDTKGPVIRLQSLTREDLFVLLDRIVNVHAAGEADKRILQDQDILKFLSYCEQHLGARYFMTPRDAVQKFVGLIHILEQNPGAKLDALLKMDSEKPASTVTFNAASTGGEDGDLANFTL